MSDCKVCERPMPAGDYADVCDACDAALDEEEGK
jgi:hypothetical protein